MRIEVIATDRNGHRLETAVVQGTSFKDTAEARKKVYDHLNRTHVDHAGIGPYIFTQTIYSEG